MKQPAKLVCIASIGWITACAPPPLPSEMLSNNKQSLTESQRPVANKSKTQASTLTAWELSGAMAARNSKKGWSASLNWMQQGPNQYQIRLFGPLGGGMVLIEKMGGVITYVDGPRRISSRHADELLQQQTGVRLPVNDLYYWIRGLPAPGKVQSSRYDANAHLTSLTQAGYTVNYSNYMTVNNIDVPTKIQLIGHDVIIKLFIKHWKV